MGLAGHVSEAASWGNLLRAAPHGAESLVVGQEGRSLGDGGGVCVGVAGLPCLHACQFGFGTKREHRGAALVGLALNCMRHRV